jgi:c-di-GMP-binding flagellar brake protein YcgR
MVNVNGEHLSFDSHIQDVFPKKHLVLADAIFQDEKIISFKGNNITVDLLAVFINEKPQLFEDVTITPMKKADNTFCYNIASSEEGKIYNRRGYYRCYVGLPTAISPAPGKVPVEVLLKDVSINGFAITCPNTLELKENSVINLVLKDYVEELDEEFEFHLCGIVVRSQEIEHGHTVYGCRLNNSVVGLEHYIMKKERIRLRKTNGNPSNRA